MSIATRITSITNHLEKDYQALESVVGKVSVNKNIENIAPLLDNLWEDLPKTTGSGTSPSISDTRAGKMKVNLLGNTSQTGTPTPDNPIPVNVVSGDNEVVVCGKNLFDKDIITTGKTYTSTGGISNLASSFVQETYISVLPNTAYTLSTTNDYSSIIPGEYRLVLCEYNSSKSFIQRNLGAYDTHNVFTITTTANTYYLRVCASNLTLDELQLEKGSTATTYEPYQSQTYEVDLRTSKNLLSLDEIIRGVELNSDNGQTMVNASWWTSGYIAIKPNTAYTTSGVSSVTKCWYDKNKTFISMKKSTTATSPANAKYIRVNGTIATLGDNLQIEAGSTATSYEPYSSIELCKIGTYQDKFIRNSGKNLLNLTNITTGYGDVSKTIDIGSLELTATGTSGSQYVQQTIGQLDSTKSYTFKCNAKKIVKGTDGYPRIMIKLFGSNDNSTYTEIETIQEANPTQGQEYVLTKTLTGYSYYKLYYYNNAHTPVTIGEKTLYYNLMLNEGSTALPYEPYGNGEWYLEKKIGKVVLDGSESWQVTSRSNGYQFQTSNSLGKIIPNTEIGMLSNYFKGIKFSDRDSINESIYAYNADTDIRILTNVESTTTNFKTWLSTHNTELYYILASPTYTKIEGTLKDELEDVWRAYSYNEQTNITQSNNDLPFELSITALEG